MLLQGCCNRGLFVGVINKLMPTIELIISGKVQGVFYRASAKATAFQLAVRGWAKNESDGSVRIRATGNTEALYAFACWCAKGPAGAVVSSVVQKKLPEEFFPSFTILQ